MRHFEDVLPTVLVNHAHNCYFLYFAEQLCVHSGKLPEISLNSGPFYMEPSRYCCETKMHVNCPLCFSELAKVNLEITGCQNCLLWMPKTTQFYHIKKSALIVQAGVGTYHTRCVYCCCLYFSTHVFF